MRQALVKGLDGIAPALAVEGAVNTALFTTDMCGLLVPTGRQMAQQLSPQR